VSRHNEIENAFAMRIQSIVGGWASYPAVRFVVQRVVNIHFCHIPESGDLKPGLAAARPAKKSTCRFGNNAACPGPRRNETPSNSIVRPLGVTSRGTSGSNRRSVPAGFYRSDHHHFSLPLSAASVMSPP